MKQEHKTLLQKWINALQATKRQGTDVDEPEGQRFVELSDTFVTQLTTDLQTILVMVHDNEKN